MSKVLLMSNHNICIRREIRKILCGYPLLSAAIHVHEALGNLPQWW